MQKLFSILKKARNKTGLVLILEIVAFIIVIIVIGMSVYDYYGLRRKVEQIQLESPVFRAEDRKEGEVRASPDAEKWNQN